MADTKHEVRVDIIADAKKFREELKGSADAVKLFEKQGQVLSKEGFKNNKVFTRASKELRALQKSQGKEALSIEKQLVAQIDKKAKTLNQLRKEGKLDAQTKKQEIAQLKELGKAHAEVHKERVRLMGLTRKERAITLGKRALGTAARSAFDFAKAAIGGRIGSAAGFGEQVFATEAALGGSGITRKNLTGAYNRGVELGFGPQQTAEAAVQLARGTGMRGGQLAGGVTTAQQLSRAGMMELNQVTDFMSTQARAGVTGKQGQRDLEKTLSNAFASGLERGRAGEFFQATSKLMLRAQTFTAGNVGAGQISSRLGLLGLGGAAGLQGERGAQVAQQLDQAIRQPGGGEAGQALVLRGLGFGAPGGAGISYTEAIRRQQRGFLGEGGVKNLQDVFGQMEQETGGGEEFALMASRVTGLTIDQVEAVKESLDKLRADGASEAEIQKELASITKGMKPLQDQANEVIKGELLESVKHQASEQAKLLSEAVEQKDSLHALQDMASSVFEAIWPAVVTALETLVSILKSLEPTIMDMADSIKVGMASIKDFVAGFGFSSTAGDRATSEIEAKQIGEGIDPIVQQFREGKITKQEAEAQLAGVASEAQKFRLERQKTLGAAGFLSGQAKTDPGMVQALSVSTRAFRAMASLGEGSVANDVTAAEKARQSLEAKTAEREKVKASREASEKKNLDISDSAAEKVGSAVARHLSRGPGTVVKASEAASPLVMDGTQQGT